MIRRNRMKGSQSLNEVWLSAVDREICCQLCCLSAIEILQSIFLSHPKTVLLPWKWIDTFRDKFHWEKSFKVHVWWLEKWANLWDMKGQQFWQLATIHQTLLFCLKLGEVWTTQIPFLSLAFHRTVAKRYPTVLRPKLKFHYHWHLW